MHLSLDERQLLVLYVIEGLSNREIGRRIKRSHTTIIRELKRNKHPYGRVEEELNLSWQCKAAELNNRSKLRKTRSKNRKRIRDKNVKEFVLSRLIDEQYQWSPEQIAGKISESLSGKTISAKTIYNFIKYERKELREYLRRKGKPYRQRVMHHRGVIRGTGAPIKRSIDERPMIINNREEFGHWEGDSVLSCRKGSGGVLSLVERKSRDKYFFFLPEIKAERVIQTLLPFFQKLPSHMSKSITLDNGSEFSSTEISKLEFFFKDKFKVFYCHPYQPQERGTVENSNGLLRQFYPGGTDFAKISKEELLKTQNILNNRPMKIHQWKSSAEVFRQALAMAG